jgi:hypothetical protein
VGEENPQLRSREFRAVIVNAGAGGVVMDGSGLTFPVVAILLVERVVVVGPVIEALHVRAVPRRQVSGR